FTQVTLAPNDLLLLCSDGLYGSLEAEELTTLIARVATGEDCQLLIDEANRRGGHDNITVVTILTDGEVPCHG
ncbi:MAG: serine/threonine-protein phosphatase, partial [Angelakisella sp.]